jgi:hypothetical protein
LLFIIYIFYFLFFLNPKHEASILETGFDGCRVKKGEDEEEKSLFSFFFFLVARSMGWVGAGF